MKNLKLIAVLVFVFLVSITVSSAQENNAADKQMLMKNLTEQQKL